jgi:hypothetical protein
MVAVERMDEYSKMDVEGTSTTENRRPPDSWPNMGCLTFDDVWMKYRWAFACTLSSEAGSESGVRLHLCACLHPVR